jgi:hypothetical protein
MLLGGPRYSILLVVGKSVPPLLQMLFESHEISLVQVGPKRVRFQIRPFRNERVAFEMRPLSWKSILLTGDLFSRNLTIVTSPAT